MASRASRCVPWRPVASRGVPWRPERPRAATRPESDACAELTLSRSVRGANAVKEQVERDEDEIGGAEFVGAGLSE